MSLPFPAQAATAPYLLRALALRMRWGGVCLAGIGLAGCGSGPPLATPRENFTVLKGEPLDVANRQAIDRRQIVPDEFRPSRPYRCDRFVQDRSRKVDVLWVIDSSPSMEDVQNALADSFGRTVEGILQDPAVDFHLGVITTDVDRLAPDAGIGPGWLRKPPGAQEPFIACSSAAGSVRCNVGTKSPGEAVAAARDLVRVGTDGSPEEKGLLAAMLALSEPLTTEWNAGFLRPDADLSIIFVSDEEDTSCGPYVNDEPCLAGPSCKCDTSPTWGSVAYFERFFRGLKGFGNEDAVRIGAIVATDEDAHILNFPDETGRAYVGCTSALDETAPCAVPGGDGAFCAFSAPRYVALAASTGGAAVDICADDFTSALEDLGLAASGLRSEFALARTPFHETIDVVVVPKPANVCNDAAPCSTEFPDCVRGFCSRRVKRGLPEGWEYVICSGGTQCNVIRFSGRSIPEPLHTISVCYDVDVGA